MFEVEQRRARRKGTMSASAWGQTFSSVLATLEQYVSIHQSEFPMSVTLPPLRPNRHVRVVLSRTTLLSFMSVSRATAVALVELGIAAFFSVGVARSFI